jgi:hypothetical protein
MQRISERCIVFIPSLQKGTGDDEDDNGDKANHQSCLHVDKSNCCFSQKEKTPQTCLADT